MDAHTLNAWTRFALQKGGIGTCTALIDNPATDQEDLMFMTGEKIIVLRRLDDDETGGGKRRSAAAASTSDADAWFLVSCMTRIPSRMSKLNSPLSLRDTARESWDASKVDMFNFTESSRSPY